MIIFNCVRISLKKHNAYARSRAKGSPCINCHRDKVVVIHQWLIAYGLILGSLHNNIIIYVYNTLSMISPPHFHNNNKTIKMIIIMLIL